jgi:hypothetical protein
VESGLWFGIPRLGRKRAGTARGAGSPPAILAGTGKMLNASGDIVGAVRRKRGDRASRQARTARALLAGRSASCTRGEIDTLMEPERPAIGMPKTPLRMYE